MTPSHDTPALTRRRFLQGSLVAAAPLSVTLSPTSEAATSQPGRPNILIVLCDQMRYPPVYESDAIKKFRQDYLTFQNTLRENGIEFHRHYIPSAACTPSRASILTGHYPSLHGVSQTYGGAKEAADPEVFWLDPNTVPTFGNYFREAGYRTYWRGKWHVSDADMLIPGTHTPLVSFDPKTGEPDPEKEALYTASDRLDPYGFSGWIGPEPHGSDPLRDTGSSVPPDKQGRDPGFAQQTVKLIQELDRDRSSAAPWLVVSSFVNPHDIGLYGVWANLGYIPGLEFYIEEDVVPEQVFDPELFFGTRTDNLDTKPSAQKSYQESYNRWMDPIISNPVTLQRYYRYYYQLHKKVDQEMWKVMQTLLGSRFKDNTIVVFTSDHGDMLGSHNLMHQKFYQAYDETIRVPLIVWSPKLFKGPRAVESLTNHIDLAPTLLGLAGIDPEPIRQKLSQNHSDARPFVGRDLSLLISGQVDPASINDPVYFMGDDDPSRGPNKNNFMGVAYDSVTQPNHIETVVARLSDGKVWKYSRYFDNPQFWSTPGTPGVKSDAEDVVLNRKEKLPDPEVDQDLRYLLYQVTVKATPKPDEFEMYNVTDDPMELDNKYSQARYSGQRALLAELLAKQCKQKRLTPCSGDVPGQPLCGQRSCGK